MKALIIVRHGEYFFDNGRDELSQSGRDRISNLAKLLEEKQVIKPTILTSTAIRAIESAEILAHHFKVKFKPLPILFSESYKDLKMNETISAIIKEFETSEFCIIVTHMEYTECLPDDFAKKVLNKSFNINSGLAKGQAWFIDCQDKSLHCV